MKYELKWMANVEESDDVFVANVPGNIQSDYAKSHDYGDLQYSDNYKKYKWMEDVSWFYSTEFDNPAKMVKACILSALVLIINIKLT